jgi:D-alanyl-D-alanine carboxypeptidase (penicillin-binding protein 5/6)
MLKQARRALAPFCAMLAMTAGLTLATVQSVSAASPSSEARYASIVVDANSGEVLYASKADSPRYPASITKVMTLYLAFEALSQGKLRLNDTIVISRRAAGQSPTKLGLRAGSTITVDQAMRAVAVKSANDMATALAEKIGGSETRFATLMTLRAHELGMTNTHFTDASGWPHPDHTTTPHDLAVLGEAIIRDFPEYYPFFKIEKFTYNGKN